MASGYKHGVYVQESPTSIIPAVQQEIVAVYTGVAPINMGKLENVNEPILCYSYKEAVENFGYLKDFENYTLCEAIDAHFSKFGQAPVVLINVLDPSIHKSEITGEVLTKNSDGVFIIEETGVIPSTVILTEGATTPLDFEYSFSEEGYLILVVEAATTGTINADYEKLDPEAIDTSDIIGGIDANTGAKKGLEAIEMIFPKYALVPFMVLAPKFSTDSAVAAVMETKASLINGNFKAEAFIDIDTDAVRKYSDVPLEKKMNNLFSTYQQVCWPKIGLGDSQYHLSTQIAAQVQKLAGESGGIPYKSPSNKSLKADRAVLKDGTPVLLSQQEANYLNGNGIETAINFIGGWRSWGNRTACYPETTDPKDSFLAARLMFNYINNYVVLTSTQKIDDPQNKTLINSVLNSMNIYLNSLTASQYILYGKLEFRAEDNPTDALLNGQIKFKLWLSPVLPNEAMIFDMEINVDVYEAATFLA